ncbi:hypothetical protein GCU56_21605 [Geodermatophilus sabuli]|uniref:Uncharacterized protein n=1 Tax=Geodermatophilus sabuli TaxID=1564158 RepID=A0A7K3W6V9_9ACTN|nr:hypothetical protein [Geodermatophilus sabuli]NEK60458.1 hypothetical protein [Geodermatophilus sabuli]
MTTRGSTDDGDRLRRCGAVRSPAVTPAACGDRVPLVPARADRPAGVPPRPAGPGVIEQLRQAAVYVETAAVLERRAGRADNPALAALLRERADVRRRTAERLRATLTGRTAPPVEGI